jgi:hypothetical protein
MERAYNEGRTTQVPAGRVLGVNKRVRRTIGFGSVTIRLERAKQGGTATEIEMERGEASASVPRD